MPNRPDQQKGDPQKAGSKSGKSSEERDRSKQQEQKQGQSDKDRQNEPLETRPGKSFEKGRQEEKKDRPQEGPGRSQSR